jgi:hypothetical protein
MEALKNGLQRSAHQLEIKGPREAISCQTIPNPIEEWGGNGTRAWLTMLDQHPWTPHTRRIWGTRMANGHSLRLACPRRMEQFDLWSTSVESIRPWFAASFLSGLQKIDSCWSTAFSTRQALT